VDVAAQPGRDISRGEMVEGELDRLIERRSRQVDPDEEHDRSLNSPEVGGS
jgi:hypothetical protein